MPINYIRVNADAPQSGELLRVIARARDLRDQIHAVIDRMGHMHDGADYTLIETNYGLNAGMGQQALTALTGFRDDLNAITGPSLQELISRVGTGN